MNSRSALQLFVGIFAVFPVLLGASGMLHGAPDALGEGVMRPVLDSNIRFRSALLVSLGLQFFWILPKIERPTAWFRFLLGSLFLGAVGRLVSIGITGAPSSLLLVILSLELLLPVIAIPWQAAIARNPVASSINDNQP